MTNREIDLKNLLIARGIFSVKETKLITVTEHGGEIQRRSDRASRRYFVLKESLPVFAVKFLPNDWPFSITTIVDTMKRFRAMESIKAPEVVAQIKTEEGSFIVEEFLPDAVSLDVLIKNGSVGVAEAADLIRSIFTELDRLGEQPSKEFILSERKACIAALRAFIREGLLGDVVLAYIENIVAGHEQQFRLIHTSGDIIDRNIVRAKGAWYLVDYEYSHKTVFGFKDAYRNILYTDWARYNSLSDFYPPLRDFPQEVAVMLSLGWEYWFQEKILDEQSLPPTLRHLRYLFWSALEPSLLSKLDQRLGEAERARDARESEFQQISAEIQKLETMVETNHDHLLRKNQLADELQRAVQMVQKTLEEKVRQVKILEDVLNQRNEELSRAAAELADVRHRAAEDAREKAEENSRLYKEIISHHQQLLASERRSNELAEQLRISSLRIEDLQASLETAANLRNEIEERMRSNAAIANRQLEERNRRIAEVEAWGNSLQKQLQAKNATLLAQEKTLDNLSGAVRDLDRRVAEKEAAYNQKVLDYIYIKSTLSHSIGRLITLPFALLFDGLMWVVGQIDKSAGRLLWPAGSRRYMIYHAIVHIRETIATATYLVRMHGLPGFWKGIRDTWSSGKNLGILKGTVRPTPVPTKSMVMPAALPKPEVRVLQVDAGVSVVIPTLNEADNLMKLLPVLKGQRGLKDLEIIVVDSGSTDDTIELAEEYGARVVRIPPDQFSHSGARNLGADRATQEYLLFMTADALPVSDTWLSEMYAFMKSKNVAAVSCMESPRIDADLFPQFENWYHYRVILGLNGQDRISGKPEGDDPVALRMNAQLSDVACLMKRDLFNRYLFRYNYAEDLDLGIRLIHDGYLIGLMSSTRVIHSHTRPPYYYLKRGYLDKMTLAQILHERLEDTHVEFSRFTQDIFYTYEVLQTFCFHTVRGMASPVPVEDFINDFSERFQLRMKGTYPATVKISAGMLDAQCTSFISHLYRSWFRERSGDTYNGILMEGIWVFARNTFDYLRMVHSVVDATLVKDFEQLIYKYFANLTGRYLGVCYLKLPEQKRREMAAIHAELFDGKIMWEGKAGESDPINGSSSVPAPGQLAGEKITR